MSSEREAAEAGAALPSALLAGLVRMGLALPDRPPAARPLAGGVSSDIWRVDLASGPVCVKRALPRLRVAAEWYAPVERNAAEVAWFRRAGEAVPDAVPEVLGHDAEAGLFAMRFFDPDRYPVWKSELRGGRADPGFAWAVGDTLGRIHAASAGDDRVARAFATDATFHDIRLSPYLHAAGERNPRLAGRLADLLEVTARTRLTLVHGDVSPKNILVGPRGPIFLDAECAWFGDPAFDVAFCLNHLLLKCVWMPGARDRLLGLFDALLGGYLPRVSWETPGTLESRAAGLLPGLMLARVDGKSPVEYLTREADRAEVRRLATTFLESPATTLAEIRAASSRTGAR